MDKGRSGLNWILKFLFVSYNIKGTKKEGGVIRRKKYLFSH